MDPEYDLSKGERGKFFKPNLSLRLPTRRTLAKIASAFPFVFQACAQPNRLPPEARVPDVPTGFDYKIIWLAVRAHNPSEVVAALDLQDPQPCNWKTGITQAYAGDAFVTPVVDGWVLVVGADLPAADVKGSEAAVVRLIDKLSATFGEAQWFASHRVVEYHGWARSINGETVRHYSYLGERDEILSNKASHPISKNVRKPTRSRS